MRQICQKELWVGETNLCLRVLKENRFDMYSVKGFLLKFIEIVTQTTFWHKYYAAYAFRLLCDNLSAFNSCIQINLSLFPDTDWRNNYFNSCSASP